MDEIRRKIIVVDDVKFHLLSMKERLKNNYEIYPAQSTGILFEILENVFPELILLDVNMPESDGYETIQILKSDARYAGIPVVFMTSNKDKKSAVKAMKLGAADFITKPFTDLEVIECIENQLNPEKFDANKPVILAVDDEPSILKSINYLLHAQYRIYTLPEPGQIKKVLKMITPDLFLLDCQMPGLSGFDLVPIIRETPFHEETPIIFVTSEGTRDNVYVASNYGASDFMVKPIDEAILREKVALHLANFVMRRRIRVLN